MRASEGVHAGHVEVWLSRHATDGCPGRDPGQAMTLKAPEFVVGSGFGEEFSAKQLQMRLAVGPA